MTLIAFIRHGQSISNVNRILSDELNAYPLTDEGRRQALNTANELKKLNPDKIYSSPVLRAYQTAMIIGEVLNIIPIIDERLRERQLGELNNTKIDQLDHWKLKIARKEINVKGVEPWDSLKRRMVNFVESILNEGNTIIAVSHFDPIRAFLAYILDLDDISAWGIHIPNASITLVNCKDIYKCKILSIGAPIITSELLSRLKL
ncbi:2,3-diphosphoglycerate-dependent phosphoglycerate mutase [Sulfurisphaera javensis]|uniref:2,3-diphosphoglycerate-dependent phosphoglycerate mutase n=1 Tax=Sulfurisphaera javensis TaxID=2049879 RepID=A0AAT9GNW6_9CREN